MEKIFHLDADDKLQIADDVKIIRKDDLEKFFAAEEIILESKKKAQEILDKAEEIYKNRFEQGLTEGKEEGKSEYTFKIMDMVLSQVDSLESLEKLILVLRRPIQRDQPSADVICIQGIDESILAEYSQSLRRRERVPAVGRGLEGNPLLCEVLLRQFCERYLRSWIAVIHSRLYLRVKRPLSHFPGLRGVFLHDNRNPSYFARQRVPVALYELVTSLYFFAPHNIISFEF